MTIRYAMLRWRSRILRLARVPALANCTGIMTKCLTGSLFRHRDTALGIPYHEDAGAPRPPSPSQTRITTTFKYVP